MEINFVNGKAIVKNGKKVIAKLFDKNVFYSFHNMKNTYNTSYPFTLEMNCGIVDCESIEKAIELINEYK